MKTEPSSPECVCNYCGRNRPETQPEFPSTPSLDFLIDLATQGLLSNDEVQILRHVIITTSDMSQLWQMTIERIQIEGWRVIDDEWYCSFCQKKKDELSKLYMDVVPLSSSDGYRLEGLIINGSRPGPKEED